MMRFFYGQHFKQIFYTWIGFILLILFIPYVTTQFIDRPEVMIAPSVAEKNETNIIQKQTNIHVTKSSDAEYIIGVLAAEMPAAFEPEALKAQAVAARTYKMYREQIENHTMSDRPETDQAYINQTERKQKWGVAFERWEHKLKLAVTSTEGEWLSYKHEPILAAFSSSSGGITADAIEVWGKSFEYLNRTKSPWENLFTEYQNETKQFKYESIYRAFDVPLGKQKIVKVISRSKSGRAQLVQIGKKRVDANLFRTRLNLRSTHIQIIMLESAVLIRTKGNGHGVGMSQWGAQALAKRGWNHEQILEYYYKGAKLMKPSLNDQP